MVLRREEKLSDIYGDGAQRQDVQPTAHLPRRREAVNQAVQATHTVGVVGIIKFDLGIRV